MLATAAVVVEAELQEGVVAGQPPTAPAPNGQEVTVTVPEGMVPGQQLQVEVPAKQVDEENLPANANAVYARAAPAASPKNAVRLVGASSLDRVGGGGGAADGVGEEPGLLQAAELQAEAMALRTKLAEAEARLVAAAKEVGEDPNPNPNPNPKAQAQP